MNARRARIGDDPDDPAPIARSTSLLEHVIFTASSYIEVLGFVPAVWLLGSDVARVRVSMPWGQGEFERLHDGFKKLRGTHL